MKPRNFTVTFLTVCLLVVAVRPFAHAQAGEQKIAPSSGKSLCSALTPADFTKVGVPFSGLRKASVDGTTGAYCVYDSKAGEVEFDIFFPAGANPVEVNATERTVLAEIGAPFQPVPVPGAGTGHIALEAGKSSSI